MLNQACTDAYVWLVSRAEAEDIIQMITQVSIWIVSFLLLHSAQLENCAISNIPPYPKSLLKSCALLTFLVGGAALLLIHNKAVC